MGRNARAAEPFHALRILAESVLTITTAGNPVVCPSNENAVAVRVCNNMTGKTVYAGLNATVDAISTPPVGCAIGAFSSKEFYVRGNSNELYIDAPTNADSVTIQILGY